MPWYSLKFRASLKESIGFATRAMTRSLFKRSLWMALIGLSLLLFANRSLAHDNFSSLNNSHLNGKVANLEINLRQLQREVGQLRAQSPPRQATQAPQSQIQLTSPRSDRPTSSKQFQNLATLVVELKQEVNALEARLEQLERTQN